MTNIRYDNVLATNIMDDSWTLAFQLCLVKAQFTSWEDKEGGAEWQRRGQARWEWGGRGQRGWRWTRSRRRGSPSGTTLSWRTADPRGNIAEVKNTRFQQFQEGNIANLDCFTLQPKKFDFHRRVELAFLLNQFPCVMICLASEDGIFHGRRVSRRWRPTRDHRPPPSPLKRPEVVRSSLVLTWEERCQRPQHNQSSQLQPLVSLVEQVQQVELLSSSLRSQWMPFKAQVIWGLQLTLSAESALLTIEDGSKRA